MFLARVLQVFINFGIGALAPPRVVARVRLIARSAARALGRAALCERGWLPDFVTRFGMRVLIRQRVDAFRQVGRSVGRAPRKLGRARARARCARARSESDRANDRLCVVCSISERRRQTARAGGGVHREFEAGLARARRSSIGRPTNIALLTAAVADCHRDGAGQRAALRSADQSVQAVLGRAHEVLVVLLSKRRDHVGPSDARAAAASLVFFLRTRVCLTPAARQAEIEMFEIYCQRAELVDGMRILDLGCGWGSL
jgi:hypothetical protein